MLNGIGNLRLLETAILETVSLYKQVIKIKTSIRTRETIIPHEGLHSCETPKSLTSVNEGLTTILNNTTQPLTLFLSELSTPNNSVQKIYEISN